MQQSNILQNVRYNFVVNVLDGTFFGLGLGFASSVAIIPLFFSTLTDDTALIGFVASLHTIGWYLPQVFTSQYVAKLRRYKPFVLFMTIHERWPFYLLALVAWFAPQMDKGTALGLALLFLTWHSLGGGFTGTAWQSMIGKIIPVNRRGTFYGFQSAAANLMISVGAYFAGRILGEFASPQSFALCFLLTAVAMTVSLSFLALAREPESPAMPAENRQEISWRRLGTILKKDVNFRWFLLARLLSQVAWMAVAFYTIYAVRHLNMDATTSGTMVGVMALAQTFANLLLGWIGDQWGHRKVFAFGASLIAVSAFLAMIAPELNWFYLIFGLAGFASATLWATALALTIQFGTEAEKPLYIGLINSLIALPAFFAPLIGGWIADHASFQVTFLISVIAGLAMAAILLFVVRDPHPAVQKSTPEQTVEPTPVDLVA